MGLRIISIVILILQLYGARGEDLPELQGNALLVGPAKHGTAIPLKCYVNGYTTRFVFQISESFKPSEVLVKSIFNHIPFTSAVVPSAVDFGGVGKFTFTKVEHKTWKTTTSVYVLHLDSTGNSGEFAYWLPQGGSIDIPQIPQKAKDGRQLHPKYVFTPNFSGCSWTVTPLSNGMLRLRHVNGNNEFHEFNNKTQDEKGGPRSYAMQYKDYGYIQLNNQKFINVMAYAYMHFSNGIWSLYTQQKTCAPVTQNPVFRNGKLQPITTNVYDDRDGFDMISGAKVYKINLT